jgi:hypothetical protein
MSFKPLIKLPFKRPNETSMNIFMNPPKRPTLISSEISSLDDTSTTKPKLSDFILKVENRTFYTHKLILYLESDFFHQLFQTSDFNSNEFNITTSMPQAKWTIREIELFLDIITPPNLNEENVLPKDECRELVFINISNVTIFCRLHQYFNIPMVSEKIDDYLLHTLNHVPIIQLSKETLQIIIPILVQLSSTTIIRAFCNRLYNSLANVDCNHVSLIYTISLENKCHELTQCCINILAYNIAFHNINRSKHSQLNFNEYLTPEQSHQILIRITVMFRHLEPINGNIHYYIDEFKKTEYIHQNAIEKILEHRGQPNAYEYHIQYEQMFEGIPEKIWLKQEQMTSATKSIEQYWEKKNPIDITN